MDIDLIRIDAANRLPKYRQIIQQVIGALQAGKLKRGDMLPSINEISKGHKLARDTVVKAYNRLTEIGVLLPVQGKGFFIQSDEYTEACRVFLLFDVIENPYKHRLLEGIKDGVDENADLHTFFHHYDAEQFVKLIEDARGHYECFVVMTYDDPVIREVMSTLEQSQLLVLDQDNDFDRKACAVIRQNFDDQLEHALSEAEELLRKYDSFNLVFPEEMNYPREIKQGFRRFCRKLGIRHSIKPKLTIGEVRQGQAWFVIDDADLVELVKLRRAHKWKLGKDLGILSYNEIPFKEVVDSGISVVSVDFYDMGRQAADEILKRECANITIPTQFIKRMSL